MTTLLRLVAAMITVTVAAAGSGCDSHGHDHEATADAPAADGSASDSSHGRPPVFVPEPTPTGVKDPAEIPSTEPDFGSCDFRASYRPRTPPPSPRTSADPVLARIGERGVLKVGASLTGYLLSYQDIGTGEMSGFEVDIVREIARALLGDPNKIQFVEVAAARRVPAIREGEVDLVLGAMTMTCDRWREVAFSTEYLTSGQRVLVNRRSPARSIDDLRGKKVCASAGSTSIVAIDRARLDLVPVSATSSADCLVLLQQGQVDAISNGDIILAGLAKQDGNTHIIGSRFSDEPVGIAMRPEAKELVRLVNGVLEQLRANGEWNRIYEKWLQPSLGPATAPVPRYRD